MEVCILLCYVTNGSPYIGWSGIAILNRVCGHFRSRFSPLFSILYLVFLYLVFLLLLSVMTLILFYQIMSDILGADFDQNLTMKKHAQYLWRSAKWRLTNIGRLRKHLDDENLRNTASCFWHLQTWFPQFLTFWPVRFIFRTSENGEMRYCTPTHIGNVRRWVCMYVCEWANKCVQTSPRP